jgi:hypothetical protein
MTKETAMQTLRAGLREGETFTITTHPHPEPSEEASSLPVQLWAAGDEAGNVAWDRGWKFSPIERPEAKIALVRLSDAQSQLNAMRAERDKWYQEAAAQAASAIAAHEELAALKSDMADMLESVTRESLAGDKARAELAALKAVAPAAGGVAGFDADDMTVPKPTAELQVGDYVFACRWGDGEQGDPWAVGWIDSISLDQPVPHVSLSGSKRGWRRAMKITEEQGHRICSLYPLAEPLSHQERLAARAEAFGLAARLPQAAQKEGE